MSTETPLKPTRTYAEQFAKIELTAEQRREAHMRALEILRGCAPAEILHEHPSGTPEWEPVCEPVPLPKRKWESLFDSKNSEPIVWHECERVVMPAVPQSAEDVVEVYRAPRQPTSLPEKPSIITKLTYSNSW
jgi:hypothetical protein